MLKIIRFTGDVIMVAVAVVFGLTVLATGPQMAVAAPATVAAVHDTRDHAPSMDAPYWAVKVAEDSDGQARDALTEVNAPADIESAAFRALLETGARGAMNDEFNAIYVKVGMVVDFGTGTITVTNFGPAICIDGNGEPMDNGEPFPCTGREYLTDEWQAY